MDKRLILPVAIMFASVLLLSGIINFQAGSAQESDAPGNSGHVLGDSVLITQKEDSNPATATFSPPSENKAPAPTPTMFSRTSKAFSSFSSSAAADDSVQKTDSDAADNEYLPIKADFSVEINGLNVNFTEMSENATSWEWDFGDGTSSTLQNPDHSYAVNGSYTVSLVASALDGSNASAEQIVDVKDPSSSESVVEEEKENNVDEEEDNKADEEDNKIDDEGNNVDEEEYPPINQEIPEFPTVAIPMLAIIGMAFFFGRKQ
ncbi:MAG: PKD domain-containing protein [Methanolobus sp.]|nr:PKD domain-containing protein [Methanolobus sp.]